MKTILVTGGSGLIGSAIKELRNDFVFITSKDYDLRNEASVNEMFGAFKPDIVIHLASMVGGLYCNISNNYDFLVNNLRINTNILQGCKTHKVKRLINILSTCVFANNLTYPLTSDQILKGEPDKSNEGYSVSKRVLYTGSKLLSESCDIEIVNLIPTNLFGKNDQYNLQKSHIIPALLHKIYLAQKNNTTLVIKGTGEAKRQFVFANDMARIIIRFIDLPLIKNFNSLIVGPSTDQELRIKDIVCKLVQISQFNGDVVYDETYSDGQLIKTVSSNELLSYLPDFQFTDLTHALRISHQYFNKNYDYVRK